MVFIETPYFTRFCEDHAGDDELLQLQQSLIASPEAGNLIRGARGLRKLRWAMPGRGKRGGARVIYYWRSAQGRVYLLYAYLKNTQADLSPAQTKLLVQLMSKVIDDE